MNNAVPGRLAATMSRVYLDTKQALTGNYVNTTVSVGARLQANNNDEVIVTHNGHNVQVMKGAAAKHNHTMSIICFSKSYVSACEMSDMIFEEFSIDNSQLLQTDVFVNYFPEAQNMYYTDEDDFAVSLTVRVVVTDSTNI